MKFVLESTWPLPKKNFKSIAYMTTAGQTSSTLTLQNPFRLVHQQTTWKGSMAIATPMYYGLPLESETPFGSGVASHLRLPQSKIN